MKNLFFSKNTVQKTVLTTLFLTSALYYAQLEETYAKDQSYKISGLCLLCGIDNPNNMLGSNENDFATLRIPIGINASIEQSISFPELTPNFRKVSIGIETPNISIKKQAERQIFVESFNDNTSNNDKTRVSTSMLKPGSNPQKGIIEFIPAKRFNRIVLTVYGAPIELGLGKDIRIQYVHHLPTQFTTNGNPPLDPLAYYPFDGNLDDKMKGLDFTSPIKNFHFSSYGNYGLAATSSEITAPEMTSADETTLSFWARADKGKSVQFKNYNHEDIDILVTDNKISIKQDGETKSSSVSTNQYNHYAILYKEGKDDVTTYVYINGTYSFIKNWKRKTTTQPMQINISGGLDAALLDDVIIYNRTLTNNEIAKLADPFAIPSGRISQKTTLASEVFTVSPNPTTGQITLDGDIQFTDSDISITNTFGKEVYRSKYQSKMFELPATLPGGIYILNLKTKEGKGYSQKVILRR
ncbi:LamG-like jellyroll fold domain-containing protein [Chryseobacterium sp. PMSZPI]|uniref:LamG-like jellyroll fold domain-containing protein n=1 Tax=Chryseobacterium sp. PMSZPI TaxID=1033900 RepID=UPI000C31F2A5|nr:LamG-like jellyroll fold domain-containing protein [Chryseobacterium sp. PMSZPI]PKF75497.1 hypothetical protein CW752_04025 [Chryseobacterium sp. PMSZPI]